MELHFSGEVMIGFIEVLFGAWAVIVIMKAKKSLGGVWGQTLNILSLSILSLTLAAVSHTTRELLELKEKYGAVVEYPEYLLGILAFVGFLVLSYKIIKIAK